MDASNGRCKPVRLSAETKWGSRAGGRPSCRRNRSGAVLPGRGDPWRRPGQRCEAVRQDLAPADPRRRERSHEPVGCRGRRRDPGGQPVHPVRRHSQGSPAVVRRGRSRARRSGTDCSSKLVAAASRTAVPAARRCTPCCHRRSTRSWRSPSSGAPQIAAAPGRNRGDRVLRRQHGIVAQAPPRN